MSEDIIAEEGTSMDEERDNAEENEEDQNDENEASDEEVQVNDTEETERNRKKPILYNLNISPAVRCVKIVAKLIDLELDCRDLDVFNGEHLKEPFIKINPEHTVPTLEDSNGLIIWDSHAITTYLIDKYGQTDALYPKDLNKRARCNQRLFFNGGQLFPHFRAISRHVFGGGESFPSDFIDSIHTTYQKLEAFLEASQYLVDDQLTVADICTSVTVTCLATVADINGELFPNISSWLSRIKDDIPFFDEMNEPFVQEYSEIINAKMETNRSKEIPE